MEKEIVVDGKVINLEVITLKNRFGIQLGRKNFAVWVELFIVEQIVVHLSITSLIRGYLTLYAVL